MTTILEEPYMMLRKPIRGEKLYGNDQYEGYCKDLADAITKHTGIKFLIKPVADGKYGSPDPHNPGWISLWSLKGEDGSFSNHCQWIISGLSLTCDPESGSGRWDLDLEAGVVNTPAESIEHTGGIHLRY